jgi:uncharacterized RDD family membrane protein YckC
VPEQAALNRRFVAVLIDWFMSLAIAHLIHRSLIGGWQFLPLAIFFVEVSILTALQGSSAGQRLLRLKVVDAQTGGAISPARVFRRTIFICLIFPAVFTKDGRGYHDWFAGTAVVRSEFVR